MIALLALICFVLALAEVDLNGFNFMALGFVFIAAYLMFPWTPWVRRGPGAGG